MSTASATSKVLRGSKRVRLACEVRFYDQRRARILDPDEPLDPLGAKESRGLPRARLSVDLWFGHRS
jgi:hypothetical protein